MKKLLFITAMLLAIGIVNAQNNDASVSQTGDENEALVSQSGSDHLATIIQENTANIGHYASIDQSGGNSNEAWVSQVQRGGIVTVEQIGSENLAKLSQVGINVGDISQIGDNNILLNHLVTNFAYQRNAGISTNQNWLEVDQIGNDNRGGVYQANFNDATIYQLGDENEAIVFQTSKSKGIINIFRF